MVMAQKVLHNRLIHMYPVFSSKPIGTGGREPNMTTSKRERGGRERISDMRGGMYNLYICIAEFTI